MAIKNIPGVYYTEEVTFELTGNGSKIPVFIGVTGNVKTDVKKKNTETGAEEKVEDYLVDGTQFRKYYDWTGVSKPLNVESPGILTVADNNALYDDNSENDNISPTNQLGNVLREFFEEARLTNADEIGVPYIYVIDVGDGTKYSSWKKALDTAKELTEATVEVYVGIDNIKDDEKTLTEGQSAPSISPSAFLNKAEYDLSTVARELELRYGFTTIGYNSYSKQSTDSESDEHLKALTNLNNTDATAYIRKSRIGIIEPFLFGKTIARICCTPTNTEPGYLAYRSVSPDTFIKRNRAEALDLQKHGIIFNRDEHINNKVYPKINLCVSTAFATETNRPADALFHARFNSDDLLREVFEACYSQIKANESETNIAFLQTKLNKIINDRVTNEEMIKYDDRTGKGTRLIVNESDADPYSLIITGQIQPVKCTIAIEVQATIKI